jgi:hypothetical protein
MHLIVKPTAAQQTKLELDCEPSCMVLEVKEQLAGQANMPATEQRLIYKGQILKGVAHLIACCYVELLGATLNCCDTKTKNCAWCVSIPLFAPPLQMTGPWRATVSAFLC